MSSVTVTDSGTYLDWTVALGPHDGPGSVRGLLGSNTGQTNDDFQLHDGTVLAQPLSEAEILSVFADAWTVAPGTSLLDKTNAPSIGIRDGTLNRPRIAGGDLAGVQVGQTISGNVLATDHDPDADAIQLAGVAGGSHRQRAMGHPSGMKFISGEPGAKIHAGNGKSRVDASLGDQIVIGGNGADTLIGGPHDVLTRGNGPDTFEFDPSSGQNTITDFDVRTDMIKFGRGMFSSFTDIQAHTQQVGADAVITYHGKDTVTLLHVAATILHLSNFWLL